MVTRGRQTGKPGKTKSETELAQLSAVVNEMKQEVAAQQHKIGQLESELTEARQVAQSALDQSHKTSRRRMLKKLGLTAAGLAAAGVAASGVGLEAPVAEAAAWDVGTVVNASSTTGLTTSSTAGTGGVNFPTLQISNNFTGLGLNNASPFPYEAIVATSQLGSALNATSQSNASAVVGVQSNDALVRAALTTAFQGQGVLKAGIVGSSDTGGGIHGYSNASDGVFGFSAGAYGGQFRVGTTNNQVTNGAPILIYPEPQAGPPTSGAHAKGELHVDNLGNMYLCQGTGAFAGISDSEVTRRFPGASSEDRQRLKVGAPPVFVLIGGAIVNPYTPPVGSTIVFLDNPIRILGPNNTVFGVFPTIVADVLQFFPMVGNWVNAVSGGPTVTANIPPEATAIVGTISAFNAPGAGFITLFPANAASVPIVATLVFGGGPSSFVNTTAVVKLGTIPSGNFAGQKGIGFRGAVVNFNIAFDVVAYYK